MKKVDEVGLSDNVLRGKRRPFVCVILSIYQPLMLLVDWRVGTHSNEGIDSIDLFFEQLLTR